MRRISLKFIAAGFLFCAPHTLLIAQERYTLSGIVKNAETGEALIGANIVVKDLKGVGTSSNAYGFYSITLAQ